MGKNFLNKNALRRLFFYGGLSKNIYIEIKPRIAMANFETLKRTATFCIVYGMIYTICAVAGIFARALLIPYLYLLIFSVAFYTISITVLKKHKKIILVIFYLLLVNIFVFSILLGTVFAFNASATAVTFHVFLFALPFLIVDVPIRSDLLIFGVVALFCFFAMKYKDASIRMSDVSNAISFGILSCVLSWVFSRRFMQQYANQLFIEKERDTDGLTRLLTKNASNILMEAYLNSGAYGCCLILDLDNFKAINDRFGHLYGDEVLKRIGKCIVNNTRRVDIVGRFGGDEFIILLTDTNVHEGIKKAYIIMAAIKKEFERDAAHIEKPITCSIGVADSMRHQSYEQLFNAADKALYKAKNAGKNRVEKTE